MYKWFVESGQQFSEIHLRNKDASFCTQNTQTVALNSAYIYQLKEKVGSFWSRDSKRN
jgi:hypothetical protein